MTSSKNTCRYVTVDVFTDRAYSGNPLAVILDADGLSDTQMQAIAREFNYVESTFVLPPENPEHTAKVRIFTPMREVPFAGHPNIGTSFALALQAKLAGKPRLNTVVFEELAGLVPIDLHWEGDDVVGAELVCPEPFSRRATLSAEQAAACLGLNPADIKTDAHLPQVSSVGLPFLVVEIATREALARAKFVKDAHSTCLPLDGANSIYLYTRSFDHDERDFDLQARMFTGYGVEDPATGSATAAASALLAHLGPSEVLRLRISQGVDMGRPSTLLTTVDRRGQGDPIVKLAGRCAPVMEGNVRIR